MKKSAIVLAVGAALGTATTFMPAPVYAETVFYGRISTALARWDRDLEDSDEYDVISSGSRWGVRASEDLGNGISVEAQLETQIAAGEYNGNSLGQSGRLAWVGLSSGFGSFRMGTQWSPYYDALGAADIFNEADWYDIAYNGPFRDNNSIRYDSPSFGGFKIAGAVQVDGKNDDRINDGIPDVPDIDPDDDGDGPNNKIDTWQIAGTYSGGPFFVGAAYRKNNVTDDKIYGIGGSFDFLGASIAGLYEHVDSDRRGVGGRDLDRDNWIVTAQYKFANNIIKGGYGQTRPKDDDNRYEWAVGFQHNLSSSARLWVEYQDEEDEGNFLTLGLRKDW